MRSFSCWCMVLFSVKIYEEVYKVKQNEVAVMGWADTAGATLFWNGQCKNLTISSQLVRTSTVTGEEKEPHSLHAYYIFDMFDGLSKETNVAHLRPRGSPLKFSPQMPIPGTESCVFSTQTCLILGIKWSALTPDFFFLGTIPMENLECALHAVNYEVLITSEPGLENKGWNRISF